MKKDQFIYVRVQEEELKFERIGLMPFDSERKIMSVIVKTESGDCFLFCKGADSAMLDRISAPIKQKQKIQEMANKFSSQSYRTMIMGMRKFDKNLIEHFK